MVTRDRDHRRLSDLSSHPRQACSPPTRPTPAAPLLFDIRRNAGTSDLCALFDVPRHALPEVRDNDAQFGETDLRSADLAHRALPICGVMGDSQASLFAQRCFEPGMAKVTLGTGSSVLLNIGNELRLTDSGAVHRLAWRFGEQTTFAFEGLINYSAATIEWLQNQLGPDPGCE